MTGVISGGKCFENGMEQGAGTGRNCGSRGGRVGLAEGEEWEQNLVNLQDNDRRKRTIQLQWLRPTMDIMRPTTETPPQDLRKGRNF
jgi:hypothetical protein